MLWCDLTEREILRFGDHRDESFDFRKRPWSCHYIFEKQVGNDCPEDQGQNGCHIACFLVFGTARRTTAQRIQNHPPFPRNVTDFINGVSISVLKYRWIRRRISPSSCCIDCKIFIYLLLIETLPQSALPSVHSHSCRQFTWSDQLSPLSLFSFLYFQQTEQLSFIFLHLQTV